MIYLLVLIILTPLPYLYFRKPPKPSSDKYEAIVVLGNPANKNGSPSNIMRARVETAAKLYKQGVSQIIIFSGGSVANEFAECKVMKDLAMTLGVPENNIYLEDQSKNTYQNIEYIKVMLNEKQIDHCLIITSSWHLRKTYRFTKDLSLTCSLMGAKYPNSYSRLMIVFAFFVTYFNLYYNLILQIKYKHIF